MSLYPAHACRPVAELVVVPPRGGPHMFRMSHAQLHCERCGVLMSAVDSGRYSRECGMTQGASR